jgi:radical SAM superfamily enzyme YgiQ (UPF0313 family)
MSLMRMGPQNTPALVREFVTVRVYSRPEQREIVADKRYLLYLINPRRKYRFHWDFKEVCAIMGRATAVHPLALPTIAALTPAHYDIRILDEEMGALELEKLARPDIVGITAVVANVKRGYEIADAFRAQGVPVVMGGAQVTFSTEAALGHADAVVAGEAEGVWQQCLADFERGAFRPERIYRRDTPFEFERMPLPRWDLVATEKVMSLGIQVSRGCPYACDFCLVRNMFGRRQRYRELDDVVAEIRSLPRRQVTFVDDNLTGNKQYARRLMAALKPLGITWSCQASIEAAYDQELLTDMAAAGCSSILFGIESLDQDSLEQSGKHQNTVARYEEALARVHAAGIHVVGSFVVGFDADTPRTFERIRDFTLRNSISYIMLNVLTAYPGTDLYERMRSQGRLNLLDPDLMGGIYPTMRYRGMSQTRLYQEQFATLQRMFACDEVRRKALVILGNGAFRRPGPSDLGVGDKLRAMLHLVRRYLLSRDAARRRLFVELMGLALAGRTSVPAVVEFLLFITSFQGYLAYLRENSADILARIATVDKGPWEGA